VWEWCADNFGNYPDDAEATDPTGPMEGRSKVLRGGAYDNTAVDCRAAARRDEAPGQKAMNIGFRVVFAPKK
jgi:formylglycine-generating enzyme required for sulfatase activity